MWIYDKEKNEISEEPPPIYDKELKHIPALRTLPVSGNHLWEDEKRVEEGKDFEIMDGKKWFWAICKCGWKGSSEKLNGGGQIADTGDYSDAYCPVCSSTDYADEDLGYGVVAVPLSPVEETNCSPHKKEIAGITDMKILAEMIGDLHYETLAELFGKVSDKLFLDASKDRAADRRHLANFLKAAANNLKFAARQIEGAWQISKPFMNPVNSKQ